MSKIILPKEKEIISILFKELKPKPKSNGLIFAKKYGFLSAESSAVTGRFVPFAYQEDILKDLTDDDIELLVWLKSTRVGYTKLVNFKVSYNIKEDPASILIFQPNDGKAGEWSKKELKPMLRDMPSVGDRIIKSREENNLNYKAFPGGFIESRGGKSANNYASATVRDVVLDEYSRFPDDVDGEGDPYELAKKRTESYWNSKVIIGSTPTIKYHDKTESKFEETDKRYRYMPCPHCEHMQIIDFKNIVWDTIYRDGVKVHLTNTAKLKCIKCEKLIDHREKKKMDKKGQWRQTKEFYCCDEWQKPQDNYLWNDKGESLCKKCNLTAEYNRSGRKKRGYHIWAGYSFQPNTTWVKIAETFVNAIGSVEKMKSFVNTWLGETFEEKTVRLESNKLMEKIEEYENIPNGVKVITMAVDTQDDRLEYSIKAWYIGETSYNIEYGKVMGDPINQSVWDELKTISEKVFLSDDGVERRIYKCFIDMAGHKTDEVKKFVRKNSSKFIMLKGDSHEMKQNDNRPIGTLKETSGKTDKVKDRIMWVATNKAKDILFQRLGLELSEYGSIHHNETFELEWFDMLTGEKKTFKKNAKGFVESTYVKTRDRNEAIDLEVYHLAAVRLIQSQTALDLSIKEEKE